MALINNGNYEIDEDSNGDLVIRDSNDNTVLKWDTTAGQWDFANQPIANLASVSTDEINSDIRQREGETVQAAIDRASTGQMIKLRPGTSAENVNITTADVTVVGAGRGTLIDGDTAAAIKIDATGVQVINLAAQTTAGAGANADAIDIDASETRVAGCWIEEADRHGVGIFGSGISGVRVIDLWTDEANIGNEGIIIGSNPSNCLIDGIVGTVNDSGTGNTVGDTV